MALDKQRILSELGSVMNQLQSADCGCMGKLFSNNNQGGAGGGNAMMGNPLPTCGGCRRGFCPGHGGHGDMSHGGQAYGAPYAGEPYSKQLPCMGHCNPPKLYADTYNYLNQNLMQPTVKEVYNDLRSITPANTMANNPMAAQMGLASSGNPNMMGQNQAPGNPMDNQNLMQNMANQNPMQNMGNQNPMQSVNNQNPMQNMNNQYRMQSMGNPNAMQNMGDTGVAMDSMAHGNPQGMGHMNMSGMGPQIMGMLKSDGGSKQPTQGQGRPLSGPMVVDAPQSPHGQVGITPISPVGNANHMQYNPNMGQPNINMGQPNPNMGQPNPNMGQPNQGQMQNMSMQQNAYMASTPITQMGGNMTQGISGTQPMAQMSPGAQQMSTGAHRYGQHNPGMAKFNEMFPGVMQGLGGDLGFDPMAIAIQMNPANQQKAAMQTMQKVMNDNKGFNRIIDPSSNAARIQPAIAGTNAAAASIGQPLQAQTNQQIIPQQNLTSGQLVPNHQQMINTGVLPPQAAEGIQQPGQVMQPTSANSEMVPPTGYSATGGQIPTQQVYTALTGAPQMTQQQIQNQDQNQIQPTQQIIDPNTGAVINNPNISETYEGAVDPSATRQPPPQTYTTAPSDAAPQQMIKEPIFPVDNSRNQPAPMMKQQKYYQYNTLGQPIEMLPAHLYNIPAPNLPQTLSPQDTHLKMRTDQRYSNVKATESKTSIMGGAGRRTPSRSQLQHIYNQYKGSHSFTQQNTKQSNQGGSYSDGRLNVTPRNEGQMQIPIEKMGGDTAANNQIMNNQQSMNKVENVVGHLGDVPAANKPVEETITAKKCRNGLQDMVYTAYPTSAAWSFHGNREPLSTGYRFK